jgi:hypothetical protein
MEKHSWLFTHTLRIWGKINLAANSQLKITTSGDPSPGSAPYPRQEEDARLHRHPSQLVLMTS